MRLVLAGTPAAAVPTLEALLAAPGHEVVAVVTRPPARAGRGRKLADSPVATIAVDAGVPVLTPQRPGDLEFLHELAALEPDCCPVVAYGALLPQTALDVPRLGWVNLHFSLLPAWRGAAPVQHALRHGDEITGASTFLIERGLDTGPVYGVVTETVRPDDTAGSLLDRLAVSGAGLMVATMDGLAAGSVVGVPQPADGVSIAPKVTVEDARVPWGDPAVHVDRVVRSCTPAPGAWSTFRGERVRLGPVTVRGGVPGGAVWGGGVSAGGRSVDGGVLAGGRSVDGGVLAGGRSVDGGASAGGRAADGVSAAGGVSSDGVSNGAAADAARGVLAPGALHVDRSGVFVGTATHEVELGWLQPPGKRPMPAADWARGARPADGEAFT